MLSLDGQVAIVTGAGRGLGRSHALSMAERGARVVVNDLGATVDGTGASSQESAEVVGLIEKSGGEAIANGSDVTDYSQVEEMVGKVMDRWGRVDILVNNAGILRDRTFHNMELEDFETVVNVHLMGSVNATKAVWPIMREQSYGRIVMTTSSSGLYGNFGQSNYGAAKTALVGFMNTLRLEGEKYDIRVNCLSPAAATRMVEGLIPDEAMRLLTPESVSAGLVYLVSKDGPNGVILSAGAGTFALARIVETSGVNLLPDEVTPEAVARHWDAIADPQDQATLDKGGDQTKKFVKKAVGAMGLEAG